MPHNHSKKKKYRYIYGPVSSWRLGRSLGIDPVAASGKVCNFDCIYCQLGRTHEFIRDRKIFVPTAELIAEIKSLPGDLEIDYITFSGRGEPTLAKNLGNMIRAVKKIRREKIAVITNSSLIYDHEVKDDLFLADLIVAKLDACSHELMCLVDRAESGTHFSVIVDGLRDFKMLFRGKLALQIMFIPQNKEFAQKIAQLADVIRPDEIQLNTPLRPSAVRPLTPSEMRRIKSFFEAKELPVISVYDQESLDVNPFDERQTIKRHGNYKKNRITQKGGVS